MEDEQQQTVVQRCPLAPPQTLGILAPRHVSVNVTVTEQSKAASEEHVHCHVQPPGGLSLWTDEPHSYACPLSTLSRVQPRLI